MQKRVEVDFTNPVCQPFDFQGGEHGVLMIHGFTGSAAHMRLIGEELHAQGFTVKGINLPGHATEMMDMANYHWQDWLRAAKEAFIELKEKCRYVSVAGLSMGGVLTMLLAEQMDVTAAAPISAPTAVVQKELPLAGVASLFVKTIMWGDDSHRRKLMNMDYHYGYAGFPTRSGADLYKLMIMARKNLHAITCPILAVQSHADETIAPESAETIMAGVSSEKKGILWLEMVPHVCTISPEYKRIAREIGELFKKAEK